MKEISLNILDITKNSVTAGAKNIGISIVEDENGMLTLTISDDGCGMTVEVLQRVTNPFYTTRTTRKVGMGIPLLKLAAEQTGGTLKIASSVSTENHGTTVTALFNTKSIDFTPIGNIVDTICILIQGNPEIDFTFTHKTAHINVALSVREIRKIIGDDVSLSEYEVLEWIKQYLIEQYNNVY